RGNAAAAPVGRCWRGQRNLPGKRGLLGSISTRSNSRRRGSTRAWAIRNADVCRRIAARRSGSGSPRPLTRQADDICWIMMEDPAMSRRTGLALKRMRDMSERGKITDGMSEDELNARHAEKMAKKKAAREKIMATKTGEKGLLIVHTGKGKGKSSAAFGMIFRHIAHGK